MQETVLTTLLYKYNPYARFIFFIYAFAVILLYACTCDKVPAYIISMALCIMMLPLVYGAISKKTVFSFRAWDNRMLRLSSAHIQLGNQKYPVSDLKIEIHINTYEGFLYRVKRKGKGLLVPQASDGDNNILYFEYKDAKYDIEFLLRDYNSYTTLCSLVDAWKAAGVPVTVKELFHRDYVHKQYAIIKRKQRMQV